MTSMYLRPEIAPAFDAAIVLGATVLPDGSPSPAMVRRMEHAVELVRQGRVGALLLTGGPVRHPLPEAWVMRDLALAAGVEAHRIVVEDDARNTIENARKSAPLAEARGWRRLLVVTDAFHLPRALYIFRRQGLTVTGEAPPPPLPRSGQWWGAWMREAAALPWTMIRVERAKLLPGRYAV